MSEQGSFLQFLSDVLSAIASDHANGGTKGIVETVQDFIGVVLSLDDIDDVAPGLTKKQRRYMEIMFGPDSIKVLFPDGPLFPDGAPRVAELQAQLLNGEFSSLHPMLGKKFS